MTKGEQRLSTTRELHKRYRVPISSCHNIRHTPREQHLCYLFNSIGTDNLSTRRYTSINVYTYTCTERLYKVNIFFHQFVGRCFVSFIRCWIKDNISACVYFSRLAITFIASDIQAAHERSAAYACNSARGISSSKEMELSRNKKYNRIVSFELRNDRSLIRKFSDKSSISSYFEFIALIYKVSY